MTTNGSVRYPSAQTPPRLTRVIIALGVAQIVSWGTLFYSIAVLGQSLHCQARRTL